MKKWFFILGVAAVVLIAVAFAVRSWACAQALRSLEAATDATVQTETVSLKLWSGRLELRQIALTPRSSSALWQRMTAEKAVATIRWGEWSKAGIPMEVKLEGCTVLLRQNLPRDFSKAVPRITTPDVPAALSWRPRIVLVALTALDGSLYASENAEPLLNGLNGSVYRALQGWQGGLTAQALGPFTNVKADFATEGDGWRLARIQADYANGTVKGNGLYHATGLADLDLEVENVDVAAVAPAWCQLSGILNARLQCLINTLQWDESTATGDFVCREAKLNLGKLPGVQSLMAGRMDVASLQLDTVQGKCALSPKQWSLNDLLVQKNDVFAVKGNLAALPSGILQVDLQLGLPAGEKDEFLWKTFQMEIAPEQFFQKWLGQLLTPASDGNAPAIPTSLPDKARSLLDGLRGLLP